MNLIFDTHALYWLATGHPRLSQRVVAALEESGAIFLSAITAYEYADLNLRKRLDNAPDLDHLCDDFDVKILAFPTEACRMAADLPDIHRDPIDRMLIAHAICADLTLVSADVQMQRYPVKVFW